MSPATGEVRLTDLIAPSFFSLHWEMREEKYREFLLAGGRGSTKSTFASVEIVLGLLEDPDAPMGTLKKRIDDPAEVANPNAVKVVTDRSGNALYFSRSPIPHIRADGEPAAHYRHIGLYVYRREFLLDYPRLPIGPLERAERLEQLRALENGFRIRVVETDYDSVGIDTPGDLARVSQMFNHAGELRSPYSGTTGDIDG